jgi:protein O-GlcNAc transferase
VRSCAPSDLRVVCAVASGFKQPLDLNSIYFKSGHYVVQALKAFAKGGEFIPLTKYTLRTASKGVLCIANASVGLPYAPILHNGSHAFLHRYARFVRTKLQLPLDPTPAIRQIAVISRSNRRRIVNENALVSAAQAAHPDVQCRKLVFDGMPFSQQVKEMAEVTVLIGMNGAGLINALYLPRDAVAIQLVPYKSLVNYDEFGQILQARGPYLEWHNEMAANSVTPPGMAQPEHHGDTIVDVDQFLELVQSALSLGVNAALSSAGQSDKIKIDL